MKKVRFTPESGHSDGACLQNVCKFPELRFCSCWVDLAKLLINGGEGGIRTHGARKGTTVFETAPFDHSGTSPYGRPFGGVAGPKGARRVAESPLPSKATEKPVPGPAKTLHTR